MARTVIPDISSLKDYLGHAFEPSEWVLIDQARIDLFAEATGDRQWIHCDPERARRESPFGTTIAHGNLTLSLAPMLLQQSVEVKGVRLLVNPGIEHARLRVAGPRSGSRVRMRGELTARARAEGRGGARHLPLHDRARRRDQAGRVRRLPRRLLPLAVRIALAQMNPTVGDLAGNRGPSRRPRRRRRPPGATLVLVPEIVLTGYPPMDLLERDGFVRDQLRELDALAAASTGIAIAVGAVLPVESDGPAAAPERARCCCAGGARVAGAGEDPAADLRRVRREALLRAGRGARAPVPLGGGHRARAHRLRGRLDRAASATRRSDRRARAPRAPSSS